MDEDENDRLSVVKELPDEEARQIAECVRLWQRLSVKICRLVRRAKKSRRGIFPDHERQYLRLARLRFRAKESLNNRIGRAVHPLVYRMALQRADTEADAAEVASRALQKILQRLDTYAWESDFAVWCCGFVELGWKDRLRSLLRYRRRIQAVQTMAEINPEATQLFTGIVSPRPDEVACSRSEFEHLQSVLGSLPPDCQKRLLMRAMDDASVDEMAAAFHEQREYTKNRLRHCRDLAREKLKTR